MGVTLNYQQLKLVLLVCFMYATVCMRTHTSYTLHTFSDLRSNCLNGPYSLEDTYEVLAVHKSMIYQFIL